MTETKKEQKLAWISSKHHKKLKMRSVNNNSTIESEMDKILSKEFEEE